MDQLFGMSCKRTKVGDKTIKRSKARTAFDGLKDDQHASTTVQSMWNYTSRKYDREPSSQEVAVDAVDHFDASDEEEEEQPATQE